MQKNENRQGFKRTTVGLILKNCCLKIGSGITPKGGKSTYLRAGVAFLRSQNVLSEVFSTDGMQYISRTQHEKMKSSALKPRDILFNITGASIGRCCMFPISIGEANVNQHVCIIRLNNGFCPEFFTRVLNSNIAKRQLYENQAGGGREGLNFQNLGDFCIPLPPLPEQEAIAGVLECWDNAIRNYEKKIAKKRNVKRGLMQKLLSGKQRLPGFDEEWKEVRLGTSGIFSKGKGISKDEVSETGLPCIRYGQIYTTNDHVATELPSYISAERVRESTRIGYNDLLLAGSGETIDEIGKAIAYMGAGEAYAGGDIVIFSPKREKIRADYLAYYLNTEGRRAVRRLGQGQSVVHIYARDLMDVSVPLPSVQEQEAIASVLAEADAELADYERKIALLNNQKRFLLNNLVTGTIRLPKFRGRTKNTDTNGDHT